MGLQLLKRWPKTGRKLSFKTLISSNAVIKTKQRSDSIALGQAAIESNFGIELGVMGKVELGY